MKRSLKSIGNRSATVRWSALVVAVLGLAFVAAGCGGGGSSTESTAAGEGDGGNSSQGASASLAEAKEAIAPYIGHPSPFPVTEPLKELPTGKSLAVSDFGVAISAVQWQNYQAAAKTLGMKPARVKAGPDAKTVSTGMETIIDTAPDAALIQGASLELIANQVEEMQDEGITVATTGLAGAEEFGIEAVQSGSRQNQRSGSLMADFVTAEMNSKANVVVYEVPELTFSKELGASFKERLESVCPECTMRTANIRATEFHSTAPNTIVSDLQANPDTDLIVFTCPEIGAGLPAALQAAGIEVESLGYASTPEELQYIKEGKQTAALGFDLAVGNWTLVDAIARILAGQPLKGEEAEGFTDLQFLRQEDITFDPSKGWTGYPDYVERFEKLWGVGG